jgi:hypothetical protein
VIPSTLGFITIRVKRRVKVLGFKFITKNVSYSADTDLVDVLATCMARVLSNLDIVLAHNVQATGNITYNAHELFHEVWLIFEAIDCHAETRKHILELLEGLNVPQT